MHRIKNFELAFRCASSYHSGPNLRGVRTVSSEGLLSIVADIPQLLGHDSRSVQAFLGRVLQKTQKVIGSDNGLIGLVEEDGPKRFIVVRGEKENIVGARTGKFDMCLSRHLIGGTELPEEDKSFVGVVAHNKKARCSGDVSKEEFYRRSSKTTQSEIAVP